jgi:superoxide dismutase
VFYSVSIIIHLKHVSEYIVHLNSKEVKTEQKENKKKEVNMKINSNQENKKFSTKTLQAIKYNESRFWARF